MAVIDPRSDAVVIRIVYDGAPLAGKSTSVGALGRGLGASVYSPAEVSGRTLYFDWLDYIGGLFEGRRIRCQIISVPGQASLAPRRRRLLESADAIVFVCDSSPEAFETDRGYLSGLSAVLSRLSGPPIGIVLQANKRDHARAVPIDKLRTMLDGLGLRVGVVESVATDGIGIREAFVFAVRLALDRVRELMRLGDLQTMVPKIDSADDLLEELKRSEDGALDYASISGLTHTRLTELQPQSLATDALEEAVRENEEPDDLAAQVPAMGDQDYEPAAPDARVASGMIWPPVSGRVILNELTESEIKLARLDGDWSAFVNWRWYVHSSADNVFDDLDQGRAALVNWARLHAASAQALSSDRCIVLAADGRGRFRLWQVVRIEQSLREQVEQALFEEPETLVSALLSASRAFKDAAERVAGASCELALNLQSLGATTSGARYIGLMPALPAAQPAARPSDLDLADLLAKELEFVAPTLLERRDELLSALNETSRRSPGILSGGDWLLVRRFVSM